MLRGIGRTGRTAAERTRQTARRASAGVQCPRHARTNAGGAMEASATLPSGLIVLDEVASTNQELLDRARAGAPHGTALRLGVPRWRPLPVDPRSTPVARRRSSRPSRGMRPRCRRGARGSRGSGPSAEMAQRYRAAAGKARRHPRGGALRELRDGRGMRHRHQHPHAGRRSAHARRPSHHLPRLLPRDGARRDARSARSAHPSARPRRRKAMGARRSGRTRPCDPAHRHP